MCYARASARIFRRATAHVFGRRHSSTHVAPRAPGPPRGAFQNDEDSTTTMAKRCENCGKGPMTGHNVSHSKVRTNRRFMPNLQVATVMLKGRPVRARLCTRCIRTQSKVR